jgi:hypothetical protein
VMQHAAAGRADRWPAAPARPADAANPVPAPPETGPGSPGQGSPASSDHAASAPAPTSSEPRAGAGADRLSSGLSSNEAALQALVEARGAEFRSAVAAADAALRAARAAQSRYDGARATLEDVRRAIRAIECAPDASRSPLGATSNGREEALLAPGGRGD